MFPLKHTLRKLFSTNNHDDLTDEYVTNLLLNEATAKRLRAEQYGIDAWKDPVPRAKILDKRFVNNVVRNAVGFNNYILKDKEREREKEREMEIERLNVEREKQRERERERERNFEFRQRSKKRKMINDLGGDEEWTPRKKIKTKEETEKDQQDLLRHQKLFEQQEEFEKLEHEQQLQHILKRIRNENGTNFQQQRKQLNLKPAATTTTMMTTTTTTTTTKIQNQNELLDEKDKMIQYNLTRVRGRGSVAAFGEEHYRPSVYEIEEQLREKEESEQNNTAIPTEQRKNKLEKKKKSKKEKKKDKKAKKKAKTRKKE